MSDITEPQDAPGGAGRFVLPVLFGAVIALAGFSGYLFMQLNHVRADIAKLRESIMTEIANLREASSATTEANRRHLDTLREDLETARRNAAVAVGQAKQEALKHAETLAKQLQAEQQRQQQQVKGEISQVREAASTANAKIADVSTDVTSVKTEVASTKSELDKTIADLKRMTGDLGVQSGLIATNSKELNALKALGDRNYFDFNLSRTKAAQKVGDVLIRLKKVDLKRNRYTVDVIADDKTVEKKDKTVNEPVQFYVAAARQPYEIVVNQVKKDQIVGYMASPKVKTSRN
jgi:chromosome segregation ATPase